MSTRRGAVPVVAARSVHEAARKLRSAPLIWRRAGVGRSCRDNLSHFGLARPVGRPGP